MMTHMPKLNFIQPEQHWLAEVVNSGMRLDLGRFDRVPGLLRP